MNSEETLYPLILNSNSLVSGSDNSTYRYTFPAGSVLFRNSKLAVSNVALYYSWFNITASDSNNTFSIIWPIAAGTTTYDITIQDGFYDIAGLNSYIQQYCITNGLYLINATGDYVYYLELTTNSNYYAIQLNEYSIPTALPVGWAEPSNWVGYPNVAYTPQIVISGNFSLLVGISDGTYPSAQQITTYSKLSDFTPQITPIQSVIMACSLVNNRYSNPGTIIYSFSPAGTTFGSIIQSNPNQYSFIDIQDGNYPYFDVIFYDNNFNKLKINDTNLIIQLLIKTGQKGVSY